MNAIDWTDLARSLCALGEHTESGGVELARRALSEIIGDDAILDAVEHHLAGRPGAETARSVLTLLQSPLAMTKCHDVFAHDGDLERRRAAIELVRAFADARALPWVTECWNDPDPTIQNWSNRDAATPRACAESGGR
jgi:hypothetical protein